MAELNPAHRNHTLPRYYTLYIGNGVGDFDHPIVLSDSESESEWEEYDNDPCGLRDLVDDRVADPDYVENQRKRVRVS